MKETLRDLRRLAEEQNVNDYLHQRWAFHAICYRASGRQRLVDEVGRLFWRADRYNRLVLSTAERFRESVGRYKEFLAACEAQDGDSAERVVHESLRWAVDRTAASLPSEVGRRMSTTRRRGRRGAARGARRRCGQGRRLRARPPLRRPQLPRAAPPRPRRLPVVDGRGVAGARDRERAPDPGDAVRRRDEPRGAHHPDPRRHHPRPLAARPDRRPVAGEPDGNGAGGRHPPRADARCRRARPLLPRRSRRRRDARRHGRDERGRHDDRSLRQDARQRARARGRAGRRARHPHGNAGPRSRPPATTSPGCSSARRGRSP